MVHSSFYKGGHNMDKITALYCRFSHEEDNVSNSIINQRAILEEYAIRNGFSNLRFFTDDGFSGTSFNRPGFQSLYKEIENKNVETIIVKDMSRFGRNYLQVGYLLEVLFFEENIRFIAINDSVDSVQGFDDFLPFRNVMNEFYAKDASKKVLAVFDAKAKRGEYLCSNPPYGYLKNPDNHKEWIVDNEAAEVVKRIFELYASGMSMSGIANLLKSEGVLISTSHKIKLGIKTIKKNVNSCDWSVVVIKQILARKEYLGCAVNHKTRKKSYKTTRCCYTDENERLIFENKHEPIIERELFETVQKMINERKANRTFNHYGDTNYYSGLIYCADCGAKMYRSKNLKIPCDYYRCGRYDKKGTCTAHTVKTAKLNQMVLDCIKKLYALAVSDEKALLNMLCRNESNNSVSDSINKEKLLNEKNKRKQEIENIIKNLYTDKLSGVISTEQFTMLYESFNGELAVIKNDISEVTKSINEKTSKRSEIKNFITRLKKYGNINDVSDLSFFMMNQLVDKIICHEGVGRGKNRIQRIDIYLNGIGDIRNIDFKQL